MSSSLLKLFTSSIIVIVAYANYFINIVDIPQIIPLIPL